MHFVIKRRFFLEEDCESNDKRLFSFCIWKQWILFYPQKEKNIYTYPRSEIFIAQVINNKKIS